MKDLRKKVILKSSILEFPLWHNRICGVSAVPGRRFYPSPVQWVKGTGVVAAMEQATTAAQISSLALELHMPWGAKKGGRGVIQDE